MANTGAAIWNERLGYPAECLRLDDVNRIQIQVFDHDRFSADDFVGEVTVDAAGWDGMEIELHEEQLHNNALSGRSDDKPVQGSLTFSATLPKEQPTLEEEQEEQDESAGAAPAEEEEGAEEEEEGDAVNAAKE